MRTRTLIPSMLLIGAWAFSVQAARADVVLYNEAGLIQGQQSFVQSFDLSSSGALTISLSNISWLDTISGLTCFLTTSSGLVGGSMSSGTETFNVGPGMIYAHWFGDAAGAFGVGAYGLKIDFQPSGAAVPLPPSLVLFLTGLAMLFSWPGSQRPERAMA